jgi:hypothetical protein
MSTKTTSISPEAYHLRLVGPSRQIAILAIAALITMAAALTISSADDDHAGLEIGLSRAQLAESERLTGLADHYADERGHAQTAEAARWTAMAEAYNQARADQAEAARWTAMAEAHHDTGFSQGEESRWGGMNEPLSPDLAPIEFTEVSGDS